MINLLNSTLTEAEIAGILESAPKRPLLPPLGSPDWRRLADNPTVRSWMAPLREMAERERLEPLPVLTDALYADFYATGVRLRFEVLYFERRRRLARAAMCALIDGDSAGDHWITSVISKLDDIAHEESWALPACLRTVATGKDAREIDLFCAETANLMGEMITVFGKVLPGELQTFIKERLNTQVFDNYIKRHHEFWWPVGLNNWNAVCNQGVVGAALAVDADTGRLAKLLVLLRKSLPFYLSGFGKDGASSEGPSYWGYGFGWFTVLNEQLENRSGGRLSLVEGDAHVQQIARYGPAVSLPGFNFVNFSDSAPTGILNPATLTYLGDRLQEESCRIQGGINYRRLAETGLTLNAGRADFFYFARLFLRCPSELPGTLQAPQDDTLFGDLGVVIVHGRDNTGALWDLAAKAGHNFEHHNHNDCGSYVLNINGVRLISEIGAPEYVKDYFDGPNVARYQFLAARTRGHSLPVINGCEQAYGREFNSHFVTCEIGRPHVSFSIDATKAYPAEAGCTRFLRRFSLDKQAGRLEVQDDFELAAPSPIETAICTEQTACMANGVVTIESAEGMTLRIVPLDGTLIDRIETHSYNDHGGTPREIRRIVLLPGTPAQAVTLGYSIELMGCARE
jgi:hypothetical protein